MSKLTANIPEQIDSMMAVRALQHMVEVEDLIHPLGDEDRCVFLGDNLERSRAIGTALYNTAKANPNDGIGDDDLEDFAFIVMVTVSNYFPDDVSELNYAWDGIGLWQA
jgi:hypothetical protein